MYFHLSKPMVKSKCIKIVKWKVLVLLLGYSVVKYNFKYIAWFMKVYLFPPYVAPKREIKETLVMNRPTSRVPHWHTICSFADPLGLGFLCSPQALTYCFWIAHGVGWRHFILYFYSPGMVALWVMAVT